VPDLGAEERRCWLARLVEWDTPGGGRSSLADMLAALHLGSPTISRAEQQGQGGQAAHEGPQQSRVAGQAAGAPGPPSGAAAAGALAQRVAQLEAELALARAVNQQQPAAAAAGAAAGVSWSGSDAAASPAVAAAVESRKVGASAAAWQLCWPTAVAAAAT
jgi:hypothetical protein